MSLNIVMTGYDHTVFEDLATSSTKQRLIGYAETLESHYPKSKITYLALRAPKSAKEFTMENVDFIPIYSNALTLFYKLPRSLSKLENISFILSQTPYEDGFISLVYAKLKKILYGVQIHNDPQNTPGLGPIKLIRKLMSRFCYSSAEIIRVVNPLTQNQLKKLYGDKVKTIPVAPSVIPDLRVALPAEPHILIVSRLSQEKGVDIALRVIAKASEKVPNLKAIIIGEGEEEENLRRLARELEVKVDFLGALTPQKLSHYYTETTILLLTSRQEGWGRVFIEGMMAGLPIVATATLGSKAIITPNTNGFLHPVNDIEGLSQSVVKLCFDEDLNNKMGYESYRLSQAYRSQKPDHELVEAIISKYSMKELK